MIRIFISSVQKEFAAERALLADYLQGDALLRRFCDVFTFENIPASGSEARSVYLDEVERADVYIGLFGQEYGPEDEEGFSPTHREYLLASELQKQRLIFVRGNASVVRHSKMAALIDEASAQVVRRRFSSAAELIGGVYASLVEYLLATGVLRFGPFDASPCDQSSIADLSEEKIAWFIKQAKLARGFPLDESATPEQALSHLRLLNKGMPTNAAVLLFAREPQRFIYSSEIKCAHFHGTKRQKPIPFYQVYKGNLFELVDQAVNFVLSKINLAVGTRALSAQVPVAYEIPPEVISEAIVNAVAHRDYTSNASIQVMLFADRLEVWNPGNLPPTLTLQALRAPHGSYPANPLIAEPLYLTKYIERMGTGIGDMIERCISHGLSEPTFKLTDGFVTTIWRKPEQAFSHVGGKTGQDTQQVSQQVSQQVTQQVTELLKVVAGKMTRAELMEAVGLKDRVNFSSNYLVPALADALLEMTQPDSPNSPTQKYRLTEKGKQIVKSKTPREI